MRILICAIQCYNEGKYYINKYSYRSYSVLAGVQGQVLKQKNLYNFNKNIVFGAREVFSSFRSALHNGINAFTVKVASRKHDT